MSEPIRLDLERPPIVEVVAAVSFENLPASSLVHFGAFWKESLSSAFPRVEEKPPYSAPIERFGTEAFAPQFNVLSEIEFPSPRLWFLSEDGDEVLQLQRNWFACNWRKVNAESSYTHWPKRRQAFEGWYSAFDAYVIKAGLGPLVPTQCELTYINHVAAGGVWQRHGDISRIFRTIGESVLPREFERESARVGFDYLIRGDDERPIGRLHVGVQPAFRSDDRAPIYVLELTARGLPQTQDIEGITSFLDLGRNTINSAFDAITSEEMHEEWGKK